MRFLNKMYLIFVRIADIARKILPAAGPSGRGDNADDLAAAIEARREKKS